ncbi:neuronal acetylcholine receptor subunit alpha-2-like [Mya arenaria]|uniref:neuronal acetylcholine receptor subunit alpha-2-like n=1 Tax=Mya arenaria TaxID=6604 RepID=UPI0022E42002|nr:neuronal acetylcholine receptor subunit alpha-2-like [Mya arenaria]
MFGLCFVISWLGNFVEGSAGTTEPITPVIAHEYYYIDNSNDGTNNYGYYYYEETKDSTPLSILGEMSTGYFTKTPQNTQNTQPSSTQRSVETMTSSLFTSSITTHGSVETMTSSLFTSSSTTHGSVETMTSSPSTSSITTHGSVETMTSSPSTSASRTPQSSTQPMGGKTTIPPNTPASYTHSIVEKTTLSPNTPLSFINALDDKVTALPNSSVSSTIRQDEETTSPTNTPATEVIASNLKKVPLNKFDVAKLFYKKLLNNYDRRIRPIQNQTHPVYVNTKFVPLSLIDFDTYEQRFSMLGYFRIRWTDEQMVWRPKFYKYINTVKFASADIWTPNIVIQKSFHGHGDVGNPKTDVLMVSWNGIVQWVPESTYSVVCDVDIQYFPFDDQTCTVTYYAADETVDTVELDHYLGTDMSEYSENPSWIIVGASRKRYVKKNNWYIDVEFRLQRRANFAAFTLITPLMMLAFLNICVFLVPINSGEKGSFSVTMFLSYGIFFTMISDSLPHNSLQISFFILLIVALLCLSVVAVFYTVIQAKLVSVIGSKQCPITCLRKLRWSKVNKVSPIEHYIETGKQDPEDEPYTWKDFLEQLDTFLFVLFLIIILLITALFFAILMRHVATVDNMFDEDPETTMRTTPVTTVASV